MKTRLVLGVILLCTVAVSAVAESQWEPSIQRFEQADKKNPPAKGGIVFVGSSSIVYWKTAKDFPEWDILNRGFGGSQTADSVEFAHRIITNYQPRQVVVYAGDNDIARGKSPETVFNDTKELFGLIHNALPETSIIYVAIKPSIARWELIDTMRETNAMIRENLCEKDDRIEFLDIDTPMIGDDGKPKPELFISDGLHMTPAGYAIWNEAIRPLLMNKE